MAIGPAVAINANTYLANAEGEHANWPANSLWNPRTATSRGGDAVYYDRLNRWYIRADDDTTDFMQVDPLVQVFTSPTTDYFDTAKTGTRTIPGEWNPNTNGQKLYTTVGSALDMFEMDISSFSDTGVWPFHADAQSMGVNGAHSVGTPGYKYFGLSGIVLFESWGYYLQIANVEHTDNIQYNNVLIRCSLTTGECEIMPPNNASGFVVTYTDSPAPHKFSRGLKNGHQFILEHLQFIPDITDSNYSVANPKGVLYMATGDSSTADNLLVAGEVRVYVKMVEFNPNGVTAPQGGINRVHGREILFSRFELDELALTSNGIGTNVEYDHQYPFFHPPSNTFIQAFRDSVLSTTRYVSTPVTVLLDEVSAPTALGQVETGRTVTFRADARGDLGEPIAGQDIAWTLKRISTLGEIFDTSSQPAFVDVANPAISGSTLVFKHNGTPLTIATDYTVVESTGRITFTPAGPHDPPNISGYTADYEHLNTPASPAHGTLRTTLSTTNSDGLAEARVEYADDSTIVLQKDQIEAVAA